jgi:hypothetical protein
MRQIKLDRAKRNGWVRSAVFDTDWDHIPAARPAEGWHARVILEAPGQPEQETVLEASLLDGETRWVVDALYVGGIPRWVHGFGSRTTIPAYVDEIDPGLEAELGAAI